MRAKFAAFSATIALIGLFFVGASTMPALAQDNTGSSQTTGGSASQSTKSTTSTSTSAPAQTQHTTQTTAVDPIWFIVGGVALLAILLIAILSMRGRSSSSDTVVHERETIIKE